MEEQKIDANLTKNDEEMDIYLAGDLDNQCENQENATVDSQSEGAKQSGKAEIIADLDNVITNNGIVEIVDVDQETPHPYDLIFQIMQDNKVDLANVELHKITNQYIALIREMNIVDWEQASEFLTVAATLLEIKAKHLLPQEPIEEDDEEDPEKVLLRKLEEYKLLKEASEELRPLENLEHFYKLPDESVNDYRYVLKQMNMKNLLDAFTRMMMKINTKERVALERKIHNDRFTVADKMQQMKTVLMEKSEVMFSTLFDADYSKSEKISTFQALLELMKIQFAHAVQNHSFDDIKISLNKEYTDGQTATE